MYLRRYVEEGIILNPSVFDLDYLPEELPFREGQLDELAREVTYFVKRGVSTNLFLYGPPGTGKTASVRKILLEARTVFSNVKMAYVNAWRYRTRTGIIGEMASQLGIPIPLRGFSIGDAISSIERLSETYKIIVVLDEVDRLAGSEILYDLSRLGSHVMLITISNNPEFLSFLDPRILSTLFHTSIEYPPYTVFQLAEILKRRAELGLRPGSYDEKVLRAAASVGFARGGDARIAIMTLLNAAKIAESAGREKITLEDVKEAKNRVFLNRDLDPKLQVIVDILRSHGPMKSSELYEEFRKKVPVTERSFRNYIAELERLGVIETQRLRVRGNVRLVKLKH